MTEIISLDITRSFDNLRFALHLSTGKPLSNVFAISSYLGLDCDIKPTHEDVVVCQVTFSEIDEVFSTYLDIWIRMVDNIGHLKPKQICINPKDL